MKDMDLVYAINQHGSFSKAAEELYIGQSSLSMAIQRIEKELGMPLFDRRRHPIQLTEAGAEYIRYYQKVKPAELDMLARIRDMSELRAGSFSLGGTHYLLSYVLPETICRFSRLYPGVDLKISEAQAGDFKEMLLDCKIDLCLKCDLDDPFIQSISHAFFDELFLAVPKDFAEQNDLQENWLTSDEICSGEYSLYEHFFRTDDFSKIVFLQLTPGNNLYKRSEMIFSQLERRPKQVVYMNQFVTAYNLAATGLGCTLTSSRLIMRLKRTELVYYGLPSPLMMRDFHFVARKDAYISKAMRAFCKLFEEEAS